VIRPELNQRSEFQRVSCRLVAARMQMVRCPDRGGGKPEVAGTDVMYRRRYVFRMQSSEWNARKEASRRARTRGRTVHKFSALPSMLSADGTSTGLLHDGLFQFSIRSVVSFFLYISFRFLHVPMSKV